MGIIGKDFKYKVIPSFLNEDVLEILKIYCEMRHRTNITSFDDLQSDTMDTKFYGDPLMESILLKKITLMEKESGKNLLPTYAFWRMYTKFSDLKKHSDRDSCEISVTVNVGSDKPWPIYIEGTPVTLEPGDAVMYLGCELEHWREEYDGDWCAQFFLQYVDKDGKNTEHYRDKRHYWGTKNNAI